MIVSAFEHLKKALTTTLILITSDRLQLFVLMSDASDLVVGASLGQNRYKRFRVIHYASKMFDLAQTNYTTTEKEMLAIATHFTSSELT